MGSGRSAVKNATFYPLPYDDRHSGVRRVAFTRGGTASWIPVNYCFGSGPAVCVNLLTTNVQPVGD